MGAYSIFNNAKKRNNSIGILIIESCFNIEVLFLDGYINEDSIELIKNPKKIVQFYSNDGKVYLIKSFYIMPLSFYSDSIAFSKISFFILKKFDKWVNLEFDYASMKINPFFYIDNYLKTYIKTNHKVSELYYFVKRFLLLSYGIIGMSE